MIHRISNVKAVEVCDVTKEVARIILPKENDRFFSAEIGDKNV
jgi:hypothetical protein